MQTPNVYPILEPEHTEAPSVDLRGIVALLKRQRALVLGLIGAGMAAAVAYIYAVTPLYTAEAKILVDPLRAEVFADIRPSDDLRFTSAMIESQVELVRSRNSAQSALRAAGDAVYLEAVRRGDRIGQERRIDEILNGLKVSRVGETYVIAVAFTHAAPEQAASYANAFAQAYLHDEVQALQQVSDQALSSMRTRLAELRKQMTEARARVQAFEADNQLFAVNGRLVSDDRVRDLNEEFSRANGEAVAAKARYEFSKRVVDASDIDAAVAAAFDNDVINNIRSEYLNSKKKYAELYRTLGSSHGAVKSMRHEISEYEKIIEDEMRRIMQNEANDFSVASSRSKQLEAELQALLDRRASLNVKLSELQGLESEAAAFESLYTSYIDKIQQAAQKANLPITDSRVIAEAAPPTEKSHPKTLLILVGAFVLSSGAGVVAALYRGLTNSTISTLPDVAAAGYRPLGAFPWIEFQERRSTPRKVEQREFRFASPVYSMAIDDPLSVHADTVRRARAALDGFGAPAPGASLVLGVVSCHAAEGKSTLAANLALSLSKSGFETLLIDGDLKHSKIVRDLFVDAPAGLGNILFEEVDASLAVVKEARTGLSILTNIGKDPGETMTAYHKGRLGTVLAQLRQRFQYVVIDLPALLDSSDVFVLQEHLDRYLMVAEAGRTNREELHQALAGTEIEDAKILGVVLNKTKS